MADSKFPWDLLKAESLRAVCRDLRAGSRPHLSKRDEMISFLTSVAEQGLAATLDSEGTPEPPQRRAPGSAKRKVENEKEEDDAHSEPHQHNTRNRGKRARQSDPGPGRSLLTPRTRGRKDAIAPATTSGPIRRKRKSMATAETDFPSGQEEVFDGVLVPRLVRRPSYHEDDTEKEEADPAMHIDSPRPEAKNGDAAERTSDGTEERTETPVHESSNKENEFVLESAEEHDQERPVATAIDSDSFVIAATENVTMDVTPSDEPETVDATLLQDEPQVGAEIQMGVTLSTEDPTTNVPNGQVDGMALAVKLDLPIAMSATNTDDGAVQASVTAAV